MTNSFLMSWGLFVLSAAVIVVAGAKLSHYGDQIARLTGLGGLWIGAILMAGATSLPEILTDVSAVLIHAPDLAVGDLFGSSMANMLILGIIDLAHRQKRVWQQAAIEITLMASLAGVLTALASLFISLRADMDTRVAELETLFIAVLYVLGMRIVYRQENTKHRRRELERVAAVAKEHKVGTPSGRSELRRAAIGFGVAALVILGAAPVLAISAAEIARLSGVSTTFIGTSLLAISTSLPELVTSLAAVRLGAFDLAVGNLFGSNAFNMCALFIVDMAYPAGPLLTSVSSNHAVTALAAILLMNIGLMGIIYRAEKRFLLIEPDSALMIVGYGMAMWVLYLVGG